MRKSFLTFIFFVVLALVAFFLLSKAGFLGKDLEKKGQEITAKLEMLIKKGKNFLAEFLHGEEEKKPKAPREDPQITKFFEQLKTATPKDLSDMVLKGFKPTKPNLAGEPPIVHMARYNNNPEVYELMLNIGASVAQTNRKGENALKVAIERGAPVEIIRILYADQEGLDNQVRLDKINEGPGAQVVSSYYPSIEQSAKETKKSVYSIPGYRRNKNLQGL